MGSKKMQSFFIKTAFHLAENSNCVSQHVGAVIVKDDRIISMGYNGTPPGLPNCSDVFDKDNFERADHVRWSDDNEVHAEMNALMFAAKHNVEVDGCDLYVTISPCNECLKNICMTGIKNIYYLYKYDRIPLNPELLKRVNVKEIPGAEELKEWVEKHDLYYATTKKCC